MHYFPARPAYLFKISCSELEISCSELTQQIMYNPDYLN
jgi:hypothetical protein